jgi:hypothetical protein
MTPGGAGRVSDEELDGVPALETPTSAIVDCGAGSGAEGPEVSSAPLRTIAELVGTAKPKRTASVTTSAACRVRLPNMMFRSAPQWPQ